MSINGETLDLVLEVVSLEEGMFSIGKHLYFKYSTNLKGLEEFIRNADTVRIYCTRETSKQLLSHIKFNAGRVTIHHIKMFDRPTESGVIPVLIDPYVGDGENIHTELYVPKALDLKIENMLSNFTTVE